MSSLRSAGRVVGTLTLIQLAVGTGVNVGLVSPLFRPPGILTNAAAHPLQVAWAIVLALGAGLVALGIAIEVHLLVRRHAAAYGYWLLALATASLALNAVEQTHLASMLSSSVVYTSASAQAREAMEGFRLMVAGSRNWSHYVALMLTGCMIVCLYAAMLRAALVPRALGWFGVAAAALHTLAVSMPLFGRGVAIVMLVPLVASQLALSLWLVARGFAEPPAAPRGDGNTSSAG
jgi:hypothetical protein